MLLALLTFDFLLSTAAAAQSDAAHQQFLFAYKLLQRGDDNEAAVEFDAYLRQYPEAPKRGDGLYYRALLHRRAGEAERVVTLLEDARRPAPQLVPAYAVDLLLGQSLSDLKRWPEATSVLERIDAGTLAERGQAGVAVSVRYLRGLAYKGADQLGKAAEELKAASELPGAEADAMRGRALLDLARVHVQRGDAAAALAALDKTLALNQAETAPEAARFAGDVAYEAERFADAVTYYDRVITGHPGSAHYGASAVGKLWALYAAGRDAAVVETYEALVSTLPLQDRVAAGYLAGSAKQRQNEHEAAVALLEPLARGRGELDLEARVIYRLAVSQHALGRDERVLELARRLKDLFPDSPLNVDAGFLAASSTARLKGATAGAAELTRYIEQGPEHPYYLSALKQRAALYEQNGQLDAALNDYAVWRSEARKPERNGDPVELMRVDLRFADLALATDKRDAALAVLDVLRQSLANMATQGNPQPELEAETLYRLGTAHAAANPSAALDAFEELQAKHPLSAFAGDAALKRGAVLRQLGRDREALEVWIDAVDSESMSPPQRALALRAMASMYRQAGRDNDAAVTLLRASREVGPEGLSNEELLWMTRQALRDQRRSDDPGVTTEALGAAKSLLGVLDTEGRGLTGPQQAERAYLGGRVALAESDLDAARQAFQGVIALGQGFDLDAQLGLAEIAEADGDYDAASAEYIALSRAPETTVAAEAMLRYGLVQRQRAASLSRQGNDRAADEALAEAKRSIKKMTLLYLDSPEVQPTPQRGLAELAEIADELDQPDDALREYDELVKHFSDTPWGRYASARIADRRDRRPDDALAMLASLDGASVDPALRRRVERFREELEARR